MSDAGPGGLGQAAYFGSTHIEVHGKSNLGNGPVTLAAWFKTNDDMNLLTVVHGSGSSSNDAVSLVIVFGQPAVQIDDFDSDPATSALTHGASLADGGWHHMAMTFTGGEGDTLRLYVDGQLSDERTQAAGSFDVDGWSVGSNYSESDYFFGSLDDVRMYARSLDAGDIAQLYAQGVPEPGTVVLLACGLFWMMAFRR